jgi:anaerobic ribonucleoside-triphosphate reductase
MGFGDLLKGVMKGDKSSSGGKNQKQNCPNCNETINLSMERCPKCGVRIKSMFRRRCPKCQTMNELDIRICTNCRFDFEAELERAKKTFYVCPICGYKMEALLTQCPACSTRFM